MWPSVLPVCCFRTAGCISREISGLPLAQWPPLVLGLSLSRQAGELLSKQIFHSISGRLVNRGWDAHVRKHNDNPVESFIG